MSSRAKVTVAGRLSLPVDIRKRHGLAAGGDVVIDDTGDAIVIRTVAQVVANAQAISRRLLAGKPDETVDDFIADRRREAARE